MTDEVGNIILEHLKAMRSSLSRLEGKVDTVAAEMLAVRQHQQGSDTLLNHDHDEIAAMKARLDRIEHRLELVE
jgi:tetrahydromethanopterin S-methyltransferase subunit G